MQTTENVDTTSAPKVAPTLETARTLPLVGTVAAGAAQAKEPSEMKAALTAAAVQLARGAFIVRERTSEAGQIRRVSLPGQVGPKVSALALLMLTDAAREDADWPRGDILFLVREDHEESDTTEMLRQMETPDMLAFRQESLAEAESRERDPKHFHLACIGKIAEPKAPAPTEVTLLSVIRDAVQAGAVLDPKTEETGFSAETAFSVDVSSCEADMLDFLHHGDDGTVDAIYDDSGELAKMMKPGTAPGDDGSSPEDLATEYYHWRAGRRKLCADLKRFIAAVEADDARRDAEELPLLALAGTQSAEAVRQSLIDSQRTYGEERPQSDEAKAFARRNQERGEATEKVITDPGSLEVATVFQSLDPAGKRYIAELMADLATAEAAGIPFHEAAWLETLLARYQAAQEATQTA